MTRLAGSKLLAEDFQLPDVVTAFGNGTNTITSTTFAALPSTGCAANIVNPHTVNLFVMVEFGAWMTSSGVAVRMCPAVSGSLTLAAGIGSGGNGPIGYGEIPLTQNSNNPQQMQGTATYSLPTGTATFTIQAMRDSASGTQACNYATLRITPLYYNL